MNRICVPVISPTRIAIGATNDNRFADILPISSSIVERATALKADDHGGFDPDQIATVFPVVEPLGGNS
jgi:hypothetical protein